MPKRLFLDDAPWRHKLFDKWFGDQPTIHAWTIDEFVEAAKTNGPFDYIWLDHDLNDYVHKTGKASRIASLYGHMNLTGMDAVRWMTVHMDYRPEVIVHSWSPNGRFMEEALQKAGFPVIWELFNDGCGPGDADYIGPTDEI